MRAGKEPGRHLTYMIVAVFFMTLGTAAVNLSRMEPYFGIFACLVLARLTADLPNRRLHRGIITAACAVYFVFYLASFGQLTPYAAYL